MPNADKALIEYEAGQDFTAMSALTDSGDHKKYTSAAELWSRRSGYEPDVRPNGLITGGAISVAVSGSNNVVDVAALSCYLAGVETSVSAGADTALTRAVTDPYIVNSITINSGGAITVVVGTEGAAASETRGAAGGPPLIPVDSIEIGQVRLSSTVAAPVAASEIKTVIGTHVERWDFPVFTLDYANGEINFASALPLIHTGSVPKQVFAEYSEPVFAEVVDGSDYVAPEISYSVSSTQVYNATKNSTSSSLGQGSFTKLTDDGITDPVAKLKGEILWFRFFPNRNKAPHRYDQGTLGIARTYPAGNNISMACTVSAEGEGREVEA